MRAKKLVEMANFADGLLVLVCHVDNSRSQVASRGEFGVVD